MSHGALASAAASTVVVPGPAPSRPHGPGTCHACRQQHAQVYRCAAVREDLEGGTCGNSHCGGCLEAAVARRRRRPRSPSMQDLLAACPVCRGMCGCKECLQTVPHVAPGRRQAVQGLARLAGAHRTLQRLLPRVRELLREQDDQAQALGLQRAEGAPHEDLEGMRPVCDGCCAAIFNLHSACLNPACRQDYCPPCIASRGGGRCPGCLCELRLRRCFGDEWMAELRAADAEAEAEEQAADDDDAADWLKFMWLAEAPGQPGRGPPPDGGEQLVGDGWVRLCGLMVPPEDVRLACPAGEEGQAADDDYVFTPHADALRTDHPRWRVNLRVFAAMWARRRPVVVRGCFGKLDWSPQTLLAAMEAVAEHRQRLDADPEQLYPDEPAGYEFKVVSCATGAECKHVQGPAQFFRAWTGRRQLLELGNTMASNAWLPRDWPNRKDAWAEVLPAMLADLADTLPFPQWCRPDGPLNLAGLLPAWARPFEARPSLDVASGRVREHDREPGDSVCRLRTDPSDTVSVLLHAEPAAAEDDAEDDAEQEAAGERAFRAAAGLVRMLSPLRAGAAPVPPPPSPGDSGEEKEEAGQEVRCGRARHRLPGFGGAGAVWHVWRCGDRRALADYVSDPEDGYATMADLLRCTHGRADRPTRPDAAPQAVYCHGFALPARHVRRMAQRRGIRPWHFEQHVGEAVFVPAGCPYQVRNLRPCVRASVPFLTHEGVDQALAMSEELRQLRLSASSQATAGASRAVVAYARDVRHADRVQVKLLALAAAAQLHAFLAGTCRRLPGARMRSAADLLAMVEQQVSDVMERVAQQERDAERRAALAAELAPLKKKRDGASKARRRACEAQLRELERAHAELKPELLPHLLRGLAQYRAQAADEQRDLELWWQCRRLRQ